MENTTSTIAPIVRVIHKENLKLFCELLGILCYLYTVYILLSSKNSMFRYAFYEILILGALFDITLLMAIVYMGLRKRVGLCENWEIWTRVCNAMTATSFIVHVYLNILIALNRFPSVMLPLKHDRIWQQAYYPSLSLLIILFRFGSQAYLFTKAFSSKTMGNSCILVKNAVIISFRLLCDVLRSRLLYPEPNTIISMRRITKKFAQNRHDLKQETLIYEVVNLYQISGMDGWFFQFINAQFWAYFYVLMFLNCPVLLLLSTIILPNDGRARQLR